MPVDSTQDTPIWLAHVERTVDKTSHLIGPWVGWRAAVYVALALIHARPWGRRGRKKETCGGWCWWSFYQSLTYLYTCLPWNYIFPAKVGSTQRQPDNVPSSFSAWTEHYSLCLSLWHLIMMSILSYLLGSGWLLISSQHSTATLLVPASLTTAEHITVFFLPLQWPASSCLLFDFLLTLDKQNLTNVSGVGQSALCTFDKPQTWIRCEHLVFHSTKEKLFSYTVFRVQTLSDEKR